MKFKYQAKTKEGEVQEGFVDAANRDGAAGILATHELFILSLVEVGEPKLYERVFSFFNRAKKKDIAIFTRQLATLLEARFPLNAAMRTLYEQSSQPALKESAFQISQDIDSGLSFSQALERQSSTFSSFYVSMVRSAEVTGNLDNATQFLADYYDKEAVLAARVKSALLYPTVVVSLFIVVSIVMVAVVFPQIGPIFEQSGVELPTFARILMGTSGFLTQWWPVVLLFFSILAFALFDYFHTREGKALLDDAKTRVPVIRKVYVPLSVARFSNAASVLLAGGVPVSQAMEIVSHTIDNVIYQEILHEVAEAVRRGESLSRSLAAYPAYFPALVPQMIAIGENTGQLSQIFGRITTYYNRESENLISNLIDLIQPLLMVGIGILVGLLFSSILLPLYRYTATLR